MKKRLLILAILIAVFPLLMVGGDVVRNSTSTSTDISNTIDESELLPSERMVLANDSTDEVLAAEVWKYLHSKGTKNVSSFVLCLQCQQPSNVGDIDSFCLEIKDANGNVISETELFGATQIAGKSDTELRLSVPLGFDFMKKFSETSSEFISVKPFSSSIDLTGAKVILASGAQVASGAQLVPILAFTAFWGIIFVMLNALTRPANQTEETSPKLGLVGAPTIDQQSISA